MSTVESHSSVPHLKEAHYKEVSVEMKMQKMSLPTAYLIPVYQEVPWNPWKSRKAGLVLNRTQDRNSGDTGNPF